jgi:hypothetical protein
VSESTPQLTQINRERAAERRSTHEQRAERNAEHDEARQGGDDDQRPEIAAMILRSPAPGGRLLLADCATSAA